MTVVFFFFPLVVVVVVVFLLGEEDCEDEVLSADTGESSLLSSPTFLLSLFLKMSSLTF